MPSLASLSRAPYNISHITYTSSLESPIHPATQLNPQTQQPWASSPPSTTPSNSGTSPGPSATGTTPLHSPPPINTTSNTPQPPRTPLNRPLPPHLPHNRLHPRHRPRPHPLPPPPHPPHPLPNPHRANRIPLPPRRRPHLPPRHDLRHRRTLGTLQKGGHQPGG